MYEPGYNSVLVKIDDKDAKWGAGNDESMLGKSYSKGKLVSIGEFVEDSQYSEETLEEIWPELLKLVGKKIMWNEGVEAGTTFEHEGQLYGFIYWSDIRGIFTPGKAGK